MTTAFDASAPPAHRYGWRAHTGSAVGRHDVGECSVLWGGADSVADAVAALASCFTYEHRSKEAPPPPRYPSQDLRRRAERLDVLCDRLNSWERAASVNQTRRPDPGFAPAAFQWASGRPLHAVLGDEITGGDFVRNTKQLIDLLRQFGDVAADPRTAAVCRSAADRLFRGVVEAGTSSAAAAES